MGNGCQNHKFSRSGILLYCAGTDGNTCRRKSRGDEKQLIDSEWPKLDVHYFGHTVIHEVFVVKKFLFCTK